MLDRLNAWSGRKNCGLQIHLARIDALPAGLWMQEEMDNSSFRLAARAESEVR